MSDLAPVDYAIVAFPGSQFTGGIAPAIAELVDNGTIRVIDIAFVRKETDGSVSAFELTDLDPDVRAGFERKGVSADGLLNEDDLAAAADELEPGSSAALFVWENLWAGKIAQAVRDSAGLLLDFGRIPHDIVQAARDWALEDHGEEA